MPVNTWDSPIVVRLPRRVFRELPPLRGDDASTPRNIDRSSELPPLRGDDDFRRAVLLPGDADSIRLAFCRSAARY